MQDLGKVRIDLNSDHDNAGIIRLDGANYMIPGKKESVVGDLAARSTFIEMGCEPFYERPEGYTFTCCKFGFKDMAAAEPVLVGGCSLRRRRENRVLGWRPAFQSKL